MTLGRLRRGSCGVSALGGCGEGTLGSFAQTSHRMAHSGEELRLLFEIWVSARTGSERQGFYLRKCGVTFRPLSKVAPDFKQKL